jgi:ribosomal protein S11
MLLFSFVTSKFWWPKKRKFKMVRFLAFIFKKRKKKLRQFYLFKNSVSLFRINKKRFFYIFSRFWLLRRFKKHIQRQFVPYRFLKRSLQNSQQILKKYDSQLTQLTLKFTVNNMFLVIANQKNKVLTYFSSGLCGFSGPTKKTSFALDQMVLRACKFLKQRRIKKIRLNVISGVFNYKLRAVLESFFKSRIYVKILTYKINLPHNGIRGRKIKRR